MNHIVGIQIWINGENIMDLNNGDSMQRGHSGKVILQDGQSSDSSIGNFLKLYTYGHYNYEIHNLTNNSWNFSYQNTNLNIVG